MELSQRGHVYSAGRPSRWASAHILVTLVGNLMIIILLLLHNDMELIATIKSRQWYAILNSVKLPLYFSMESIGSV